MQSPKFSLVDFLYNDVGIKIKLMFKESKGSIGSEKIRGTYKWHNS